MSSAVSWADQVDASDRRQRSRSRGRPQNRTSNIPLSWFTSIVDESNNFTKLMPATGVPTGMGTAQQQCGYWYRAPTVYQVRRGKRVPLPTVWYYYFLGTGPHAGTAYGTALDGVYWVKTKNGQIDPKSIKSLGVRDNQSGPKRANVPNLPEGLRVMLPQGSRPQSRAQSQNSSRAPSVNRGGSRASSVDRTREDLKAVVAQLLSEMGVCRNKQTQSQSQSKKKQKGSTPAGTPHPNQDGKPAWKRKPNEEEDVTKCFGPRSDTKNFGDDDFIRLGVDDPRFKTVSYYAPGAAASLFDSKITVTDGSNGKKIVTFHTSIEVDSTKPSFEVFMSQVDAYVKRNFHQTQALWESRAAAPSAASYFASASVDGAGDQLETFEMTDETNA